MSPPKRDVSAQLVEGIMFRKDEYVKVMCTSFGHHYCLYPSNAESNHDHAQAQQLISMCCFAKQWADSLLGHCRAIFSCHANDSR